MSYTKGELYNQRINKLMSFTKLFPHVASGIAAWANENSIACHIICDTKRVEGLPPNIIKKFPEQITLSIGSEATNGTLDVNQQSLTFHCRFNGSDTSIMVPLECIQYMSVQEAGMIVGNECYVDPEQKKPSEEITFSEPSKSKLRIVE